MDFPQYKNIEYELKAPGFKGAFVLSANYDKNNIEYRGKLTVSPLGLNIFKFSKRMGYEACSRSSQSYLFSFLKGKEGSLDKSSVKYDLTEKDDFKRQEFQTKSPFVEDTPQLDILQFFFLAPSLSEKIKIEGVILSGKLLKFSLERVSQREVRLAVLIKGQKKELSVFLNEEKTLFEKLEYRIPLVGKITVALKNATVFE